ncbi:DUF4124 domain-containing protein [Stenotrophomonas tumulicola]|uniref:DUF4124 domain-containing protein n=1 Tax=Stenotrophomonas tumulicola TaxID=1685415 RepID=A0A7W3FNH4_9GAMM|nr:DUF4124 domain-containing protein [Stenotrophomonas tumulicola]MBA8682841.1 DUF4124 domain-containing protein [Stenotrophomonas tumulicola]
MNSTLALLLSLLLAGVSPPVQAQAQRLNRCSDATGQSVYTDRPCETVGARSRMPAASAMPGGNTLDRDQLGARCPRRLSELVGALRGAVAANDVNRLSSLYLWSAVSDAGAQRVLGQLESIARRPLVDIVPVYPAHDDDAMPPPATEEAAAPPVHQNPIALRLEQVLPGTATPSRSVLGLRRQYGCFWITL